MSRGWDRRGFLGSLAMSGAALAFGGPLAAASILPGSHRDLNDDSRLWTFDSVASNKRTSHAVTSTHRTTHGMKIIREYELHAPAPDLHDGAVIDPTGESSLSLIFRRACAETPVVDLVVALETLKGALVAEARSDNRGRILIKDLEPGRMYQVSVKPKKGQTGYYGLSRFVRTQAGRRSYAVVWVIDNYWPWDDDGTRRRFPTDFFLETTFTPYMYRFRHPGDDPAANFSRSAVGKRSLTFYIDPAYDEVARQTFQTIILNEWVPMTDFRIAPRFEIGLLEDGDPRCRDSFRIVHDEEAAIAELFQQVDRDGFLINSKASFSGSSNWDGLSSYVTNLLCEFFREYAGFALGPRYYDNKPWVGGASFMRYPGPRRYTWFDRNVVAKVLYRLPAKCMLRHSDVAAEI